jgi:hypothetical protein
MEKLRSRYEWRSERDSNRGYGFLAGHGVQIESDLRPQSSKREYFKFVPETIGNSEPELAKYGAGDNCQFAKASHWAGPSWITEGKTTKRRTGRLGEDSSLRTVGSTALLFHRPMSNDLAQN